MEISASMGAAALNAPQSPPATRSTQEASESMRGPDNDADRDDQVAVNSQQSTPAVNAMGETIGQLLNVSA